MYYYADKLPLVAKVNRTLNKELMGVTSSVKSVFEAFEKINTTTLHLVAPSYFLLRKKLQAVPGECRPVTLFRAKLRKFLDEKYWTSINALHWIASFLDPTFKNLQHLPQTTRDEAKFKRDLWKDLDTWLLAEMASADEKMAAQPTASSDDKRYINVVVSYNDNRSKCFR